MLDKYKNSEEKEQETVVNRQSSDWIHKEEYKVA